ncbi:hypothetical protein RCJ22_14465 [Vibrio sp. FNV 38]|nr:hypothetical protein [Vibrio sp. FNV 38]
MKVHRQLAFNVVFGMLSTFAGGSNAKELDLKTIHGFIEQAFEHKLETYTN